MFENLSRTAGISADFTTAKILLFFHACLLHKMDGKTRENVGESQKLLRQCQENRWTRKRKMGIMVDRDFSKMAA